MALELVTDLANELMGYHKNQDVSTCCSLDHIWDSHLWGEQKLMYLVLVPWVTPFRIYFLCSLYPALLGH